MIRTLGDLWDATDEEAALSDELDHMNKTLEREGRAYGESLERLERAGCALLDALHRLSVDDQSDLGKAVYSLVGQYGDTFSA